MEIENLTIKKARNLLDTKAISVKELALACLANIEKRNKELNVFLEVYPDVLEQAEEAQKIIDRGESRSLTGIPLGIKDNILIKGKKASSASKILENYTATYTATASQKIIAEKGVFLGRLNMDEFACGGSTENSAFGVTRNPSDPSRVSGGSSGGSAASVASSMCLGSLGSDTGGSVREPASFCGVVGLKPTYGSVSRYGLMAMGSSLDIIGPIAKTVSDVEVIFDCIKGRDKMDATSIDENIITPQKTEGKLKIGVPFDLLNLPGIAESVSKNFFDSVEKFKSLGFEIIDIKLPNIDKALAVYYIVMPAELSSNLARFDGIKYGASSSQGNLLEVYKKTRGIGFGKEIRRRIILGTYVLSSGYYDAYYGKALQASKVIKAEFDQAFKQVDLILTPTAPTPAWKVGEKSSPLEVYLADVFTVSANIARVPAISLPSGFDKIKTDSSDISLPLGIQLIANEMSEKTLFTAGKSFLGE
jgi:aspartyl-tRNA(Asn)/glutamyl-tRNA(Gln) amidotransferase subunit A